MEYWSSLNYFHKLNSVLYAENTSLELRSNFSTDFNRQKNIFRNEKNDGGGVLGHPPPLWKIGA